MVYTPFGTFNLAKAGHTEGYYSERHISIDYRGLLKISPLSYFGWEVMIITATHNVLETGSFTAPMKFVPVIVDDYAWVTSRAILYNCHIMHHAIVSIGAVVSGMVVEPYTVVKGNPAIVIAKWDIEKKRWVRP